jgi:hypothetical protein
METSVPSTFKKKKEEIKAALVVTSQPFTPSS